jgi:hypothetical protein
MSNRRVTNLDVGTGARAARVIMGNPRAAGHRGRRRRTDPSPRSGQRRGSSVTGFVVLAVLALLAMPFAGWTTPARGAGAALFPDLVAFPPADLYVSREALADGRAHLLLRFTASSWNAGEGPLELAGAPEPGGITVWQQIYDAPTGGQVVARRRLAADLFDHPQHRHFHLADYFAFTLTRRGPFGISWSLPSATGKLSSCVFDDILVDQANQPPRHYTGCGADTQGMSPGWGDTYDASLPGQWVDLGDGPLPDGTYALRVTVDPLDRIAEGGRESNNAATIGFVVRGGRIVGMPEPARCSLVGEAAGPVEETVELACTHFPQGASVAVYWDGRDPWAVPPHRPVTSFAGAGAARVTVRFPVPETPVGGHTVAAVVVGHEEEAAAVIYGVEPSLAISPIPRDRAVLVTLHGFGPEEEVVLAWQGAMDTSPAARLVTSPLGSATTILAEPDGSGPRRLRAVGELSGASAEAEPTVVPPDPGSD